MIAPPHAADRPSPPRWVALVEAAQRGDRQAFSRLHREFGAMVHGLLLARVDPTTADDLTQDVFLLAWQRIDRLHEPRAWPAWLATIARHRAVDHLRAARRPGTLPPELPSSSPDPLVRTEAERLLALIRELPDALLEPLILRLVEGLSGPEIAERTGLSPGYVRVNLHRGMKLLRQRLGETR
ncbi:MAG: sigma-70 family RNA polymerase sigma factor [Enhygromyxa sp.]